MPIKEVLIWARQWPTAATMIIGILMLGWILSAETGRMAKADDLEKVRVEFKAQLQETKEEFTKVVNNKVSPLNAGFAVILRGNIRNLTKQIRSLEYKRDYTEAEWPPADQEQLDELIDQRALQQAALDQMIESSGPG